MEITIKFDKLQKTNDGKLEDRKTIELGSNYSKWFNDTCKLWVSDSYYNRIFLVRAEGYANDLLRANGYVFLNQVYEMLGIPKTKAGQIVGWVYDEKNPIGDNYIDFGLMNKYNSDFINGFTKDALLNFNVDGCILDRI